jgi:hypothetical protein
MTRSAERGGSLAALLLALAGAGVSAWLLVAERATFRQAFLLGMAAVTAALVLLAAVSRRPFCPRPLIATRGELVGFLFVLAVGTAVRTIGFDTFPPDDGQHSEEAQLGAGAYRAIHDGHLDSFFPLTTLTAEAGFRLFGVSMRAMRLPFVFLGILSVPLFFAAARLFFASYGAALFATGLFATNAFLAGSSRIALESMSPITTECLALLATFYACLRHSNFAAAFAGFSNALLLLEYFSYKLAPLPAALLLLGRWMQDGNPPNLMAPGGAYRWRNLLNARRLVAIAGIFAIGCLAVVLMTDREHWAPMLEGYLRHRMEFDRRALPWRQALDDAVARVGRSATFFFAGGEGADILPVKMGLIDPFTAALAVAGLAWCALGARRSPGKLFLPLAAVLYIVLSGVLVPTPKRYRLIPLIPYFCLAGGVVIDELLTRFPRRRAWVGAASAALLVALGAYNIHRFFIVAVHHPTAMPQFEDVDVVIAQGIANLQKRDPGAPVYLLSERDFFTTINDYYFLYDYNLVKVAKKPEELAGARGFVMSHEPFLDRLAAIAGAHGCWQWRARSCPTQFRACRLPDR